MNGSDGLQAQPLQLADFMSAFKQMHDIYAVQKNNPTPRQAHKNSAQLFSGLQNQNLFSKTSSQMVENQVKVLTTSRYGCC